MQYYAFNAMDGRGRKVQGVLEGQGEDAVILRLRDHGLIPLKVSPAPKGAEPTDLTSIPKPYRSGDALDPRELNQLQERLMNGEDGAYQEIIEQLERAVESLEALGDELAVRADRQIYSEILKSVREMGSPEGARRAAVEERKKTEELREQARAGNGEALEELAPFRIGPGVFTAGKESDIGTLVFEPETFVGFVSDGNGRKHGRILCAPGDLRDLDLKGWKHGRVLFVTQAGESWEFRIDRSAASPEDAERIHRTFVLLKRLMGLASPGDSAKDLLGGGMFRFVLRQLLLDIQSLLPVSAVSAVWGFACIYWLSPVIRRMGLPNPLGIWLALVVAGIPLSVWYYVSVFTGRRKMSWPTGLVIVLGGGGVFTTLVTGVVSAIGTGIAALWKGVIG